MAFSFRQLLTRWSNISLPTAIADRDHSVCPAYLYALVGFFCFVMFVPGVLLAQTEIEGEVSGVWNQEGSPYIIIGDATILEDELLEVEAGTDIIFDDGIFLFIEGIINAVGSVEDSIHIKGDGPHGWSNLQIMESSGDNSLFQYVFFDSVNVEIACPLTFRNNRFYHLNLRVRQDNNPHPLFENNLFDHRTDILFYDVGNYEINGNDFIDGSKLYFNNCGNITLRNLNMRDEAWIDIGRGGGDLIIDECRTNQSRITGFAGHIQFIGGAVEEGHMIASFRELTIEGGHHTVSAREGRDVLITGVESGGAAISDCRSVTIRDCDGIESISGGRNQELNITNNRVLDQISVTEDNVLARIENNQVGDRIQASGFETYVVNNITNRVICRGSDEHETAVEISNNKILEEIECKLGAHAAFLYNDIGQWQNNRNSVKLIDVRGDGTEILFRNNSIYESEDSRGGRELILVQHGGFAVFENNLIMGDGNGSDGIVLYRDGRMTEQYNVFWGLDSIGTGWELSETSRIINPRIMDRRARDVNLQAVSPLINTGRRHGDDPDGSRTDIGCFYYDHRENHPPFIDSPFEVEADVFTEFVYEVTVTDDGDNVNVTVEDLPDWLEIVERDNVEVVLELRGNVPEEWEEEYHFLVRAEDDAGLTDTMTVQICVNPSYLLYGDLPDRLESRYSPYIVTEHIVIPEDDALVIEPGVELRFRQHADEGRSASLRVLGSLHAIGNENEQIIFSSEFAANRRVYTWPGVLIQSTDPDSTILDYCQITHARNGVYMSGNDFTRISHSTFQDNWRSLFAVDNAKAIISENSFFPYSISTNLDAIDSDLDIEGNFIFDQNVPDTMYTASGQFTFRGDNYRIRNNLFQGNCGIRLQFSNAEVYQNIFKSGNISLNISNACSSKIYNNIFYDITNVLYVMSIVNEPEVSPQISNNVFMNCDSVVMRGTGDPDSAFISPALITNNLFYNNSRNFYKLYTEHNLGLLNDVNRNNDSCDAYQNIFMDPLFIDPEGGNFQLSEFSPCIDAGIDVGLLFAGNAPDIGLFEFDLNQILNNDLSLLPKLEVMPCYPNPFNSVTMIQYILPFESDVNIQLFNLTGQRTRDMFFHRQSRGKHQHNVEMSVLPSGVYFLTIAANGQTSHQKIQLIK